jgi:hypothetical protein
MNDLLWIVLFIVAAPVAIALFFIIIVLRFVTDFIDMGHR